MPVHKSRLERLNTRRDAAAVRTKKSASLDFLGTRLLKFALCAFQNSTDVMQPGGHS
jgi:hypothetical protein